MLCNCPSGKHEAQFSKVEVNKDTFAFSLSVPSAQTHSPPWSPLWAWLTLPAPFWAWQEPPGVLNLCFTPCVLGAVPGAGSHSPGCLGVLAQVRETLPLAGARGHPCHCLSPGEKAVLLGSVCVPAGCCCYSMATGSNHINGISNSRKVIKDNVTRHGLLMAW